MEEIKLGLGKSAQIKKWGDDDVLVIRDIPSEMTCTIFGTATIKKLRNYLIEAMPDENHN